MKKTYVYIYIIHKKTKPRQGMINFNKQKQRSD
jgi:hypothetical protein